MATPPTTSNNVPSLESEEWLARLIEHEIAYCSMIARADTTEYGTFFHAPDAPGYQDGNRAIGLRIVDRSASLVAEMVASAPAMPRPSLVRCCQTTR